MVVYDLIEFSKVLRKRLLTARTDDIAKEIAIEIKCATHPDGKLLTVLEKDKVIKYIKYNPVNDGSGRIVLQETDNSEFLKLVAIVDSIVRSGR